MVKNIDEVARANGGIEQKTPQTVKHLTIFDEKLKGEIATLIKLGEYKKAAYFIEVAAEQTIKTLKIMEKYNDTEEVESLDQIDHVHQRAEVARSHPLVEEGVVILRDDGKIDIAIDSFEYSLEGACLLHCTDPRSRDQIDNIVPGSTRGNRHQYGYEGVSYMSPEYARSLLDRQGSTLSDEHDLTPYREAFINEITATSKNRNHAVSFLQAILMEGFPGYYDKYNNVRINTRESFVLGLAGTYLRSPVVKEYSEIFFNKSDPTIRIDKSPNIQSLQPFVGVERVVER